MKQLFPLAWASLKSRKRATMLLLTTIILSVVFLVVMGIIGSSSLYTLDVQHRDAYGEQQVVAWHLTAEQQTQLECSSAWNAIGKMTIYGVVDATANTNTVFGIGTIDEQAMALGHIRLAEGRLPQAANEVALEKSVYKYIGNQAYAIGDTITLEENAYTVVGFLENYSAVWQTAYSSTEGTSPMTVSFLISEAGKKQFVNGSATVTWLLNSTQDSYLALTEAMPAEVQFDLNDSVYPEISYSGDFGGDTLSTVSTNALIGSMIMVCMMMILLNGFLMSLERRKQQFSLLRCIGATKKQACQYIFCEGFLLMGLGIPAGLVFGILLSFGAVKIFAVVSHVTMLYRFDVWILLVATVVCIICVFIALLIPAIRASKSTPIAGVGKGVFQRNHKAKYPRQQKRKLSPFSLMLISMRKSKGKILLTTVAFGLVIVIFTFMMLFYLAAYQTPYEIADVTLSIPGATSIVQPDLGASYVVDGKTENDTVLLESMERVQNMASNVQQSIQVVPNFICAIPFEEYDAYLNGCFLYDLQALGLRQEIVESYQEWQYDFEEQQTYGYGTQEYLVSPAVTIFDENLLQMTSQYVVDGRIDVEAINSGEEIILTMPDYVLQVSEDKDGSGWGTAIGSTEEPPSNVKDDEIELYTKLCTNINWKAGDTLALTWVESNGESYETYRKTVRIGAVVQQEIPLEGAQFVFGMIVGEQTLVNLGLPYETAYQHIYFSADADVTQTEAELQQFVTQNYPQLQVTSKTEATAFEQQMRRTVITVVSFVIVCLLSLGFLGLLNTVSSRIHSRLHEIGLLRSIGMTKGQVYRMLVYEGAIFGVLSSLLGVAASCWILPMFKPYWMQTAAPLYLALACVICIALSVLTIFLPARNVLQNTPTEITHFR